MTRLFQWSEGGEVAFDVVGQGRDALLLPALSSISSRSEMHSLAERLAADFRCCIPDCPGFGTSPYAAIRSASSPVSRISDSGY